MSGRGRKFSLRLRRWSSGVYRRRVRYVARLDGRCTRFFLFVGLEKFRPGQGIQQCVKNAAECENNRHNESRSWPTMALARRCFLPETDETYNAEGKDDHTVEGGVPNARVSQALKKQCITYNMVDHSFGFTRVRTSGLLGSSPDESPACTLWRVDERPDSILARR